MYSTAGLGQTYANGWVQMPYSNVLIQSWSDAAGNRSSTWQGYYLATYGYRTLPPILAGSPILSQAANSITFVISDAQVQAILHGNSPATPAGIPNQPVAAIPNRDPLPVFTASPVACTTAQCQSDLAALNSGGAVAASSSGLFGLSMTEILIGAGALGLLWLVSK